eukprot:6366601-Amphidinium_carterae.1
MRMTRTLTDVCVRVCAALALCRSRTRSSVECIEPKLCSYLGLRRDAQYRPDQKLTDPAYSVVFALQVKNPNKSSGLRKNVYSKDTAFHRDPNIRAKSHQAVTLRSAYSSKQQLVKPNLAKNLHTSNSTIHGHCNSLAVVSVLLAGYVWGRVDERISSGNRRQMNREKHMAAHLPGFIAC